jgi:hypothetical protein
MKLQAPRSKIQKNTKHQTPRVLDPVIGILVCGGIAASGYASPPSLHDEGVRRGMGRGVSNKNIRTIRGLVFRSEPSGKHHILITSLLSPTLSSGFARKRGRKSCAQATRDCTQSNEEPVFGAWNLELFWRLDPGAWSFSSR